ILLYELLTGIAPFRADTAIESIRLIKEHDPVAPRKLQPTVPSDLNTICLKCLAKEPTERYATAGAVADELRRFDKGLPILAKPPTSVARLWKWTMRRPLMATLIATALIATLVALTAWAKYTRDIAQLNRKLAAANAAEKREKEEAARQKDEVTKQRDIARKVRYFLIHDLLYSGTAAAQIEELKQQGRDASEYERDPRLSTMLRLAINSLRGEGLERRFPNQPETQQEMLLLLADLSRHGGDNVQSLQLFQRALSDDHQQHPDKSDLIISNLIALDLVALGQTDEAIETYEWLVEKNRQLGDEKMLAATLHNLSGAYLTADKNSELALKYVDEAIQIADQQYGPDHPQTLGFRSTRASLLDVLGRPVGSLEELGKVVDGLKLILGAKHPKTIFNRSKLANSYLKSGRKKDAIDVLNAVVSDSVVVHGDDHPRTIGYRERLEKLLIDRQ
ncbi:MAG: tetratricopeptide repeat protein, partial [Planctomycetota bacterium]